MASNTPNLDLYMKDPVIDGNDTFNIKTMMNDNWEKIDKKVVLKESGKGLSTNDYTDAEKAKVQSHENEINNVSNKTATLKPGIQTLTADRTTPFNVSGIKGRTLVNLLGRDGNCEDISKWNGWQASLALDSNKAIGSNAIKVTSTAANAYFNVYKEKTALLLKAGKYYVVLAEARNGIATDQIGISFNPSVSSKQLLKTSDSTAFKTVCSKLAPTVDNQVNIEVGSTATAIGQYFYVDAIRLYEITVDEYAALDSMTPEQIAAKYPYVDDVKPIRNPYAIRYGKNLLPPFTEWRLVTEKPDYIPNSSTHNIIGPYKASITAPDTSYLYEIEVRLNLVGGQTYTLNPNGGRIRIAYFMQDGTVLRQLPVTNPITFTAPQQIREVAILLTNLKTLNNGDIGEKDSGTFTFEKPMLNIGDTALPFEPQNNDYVFYDTVLHSNVDGTVRDELFYRDGQPRKLEKFREIVLGGSLSYEVQADKTGFKNITIKGLNSPNVGLIYGVKFDGKILKNVTTGGFDIQDNTYSIGDGNIYITISDTNSGWGENYTPSLDEIKAYFNGWKMYDNVKHANPYPGTGTRAWVKLSKMVNGEFVGIGDGVDATNTLPTSLADGGYTPYRLIYQLAQPVEVPITSEGKITLHEGTNVLEVGTGVVIREKTIPVTRSAGDYYSINSISGYNAANPLTWATSKILEVQRNDKKDTNWQMGTGLANAWNGTGYAVIPTANYDLTAAYSVTYLVLDRYAFTAPLIDLQGEYRTKLAAVVAEMVEDATNLETRVSVVEVQYARKQQGQWITPVLINGWVYGGDGWSTPGYFKDEFGIVHLKGYIKGGTATMYTPFFKLPAGYRPKEPLLLPAYSNTTIGGVCIRPNGEVQFDTGSNNWFSLNGISFRAEQ